MAVFNPPPQRVPDEYKKNPKIRDYEERQKEVIRLLYLLVAGGTKTVSYSAKTGDYTITASDYLIEVTSGSPTITLPPAADVVGHEFVVKNSGTGIVTVTGSETIDDSATQVFGTKVAITVVSNATQWIIV